MTFAAHRPVNKEAVEELKTGFRGEVLQPDEDGYDEARSIWNAIIDRRPAVIAQPAGAADVISSVNFGQEHDLQIAVKGGGHNVAGNAVCDYGLMIDLSLMDSVQVNPDGNTARVEAGATLGDVDHETQAFGLATPLGINSTTGVAGLTLGGGFGWLSRKYGLTIDNLLSADVVTSDGELVRASEDENPDLFWGIRGGSGNFGIVTSFEFRLHEVGPEVFCGPIVYSHDDAAEVLEFVREFSENAPNEVVAWPVLRKAPPLPFLPEEAHGTDVCIVAAFYAGSVGEGKDALAPLQEFGDPIADAVEPHPYVGWQQAFDPLLEPGLRNYWKTHNFEELNDEVIETALEYARTVPSPHTEIIFGRLGGAVNDIPVDATAYPHRDVNYVLNVHTRWEDASQDEECIEWVRDLHDKLAPYATGGAYVNFITEREGEEDRAYEENYDRLVELKNEWDPENVFRMNQNIEPTG
ncbi:FAD-binding oxidoreductase [Haladaptatus halobius]|uniref:FAD-binding oxidoreductase n=1 Tax=Haladaptatus halobius TaxID=2884875 RepID=UPI001D0A66F9|nr:FAD-binding oxidoreductase [Haladaptatus halobius]